MLADQSGCALDMRETFLLTCALTAHLLLIVCSFIYTSLPSDMNDFWIASQYFIVNSLSIYFSDMSASVIHYSFVFYTLAKCSQNKYLLHEYRMLNVMWSSRFCWIWFVNTHFFVAAFIVSILVLLWRHLNKNLYDN